MAFKKIRSISNKKFPLKFLFNNWFIISIFILASLTIMIGDEIEELSERREFIKEQNEFTIQALKGSQSYYLQRMNEPRIAFSFDYPEYDKKYEENHRNYEEQYNNVSNEIKRLESIEYKNSTQICYFNDLYYPSDEFMEHYRKDILTGFSYKTYIGIFVISAVESISHIFYFIPILNLILLLGNIVDNGLINYVTYIPAVFFSYRTHELLVRFLGHLSGFLIPYYSVRTIYRMIQKRKLSKNKKS
jgi:hypothetical protein